MDENTYEVCQQRFYHKGQLIGSALFVANSRVKTDAGDPSSSASSVSAPGTTSSSWRVSDFELSSYHFDSSFPEDKALMLMVLLRLLNEKSIREWENAVAMATTTTTTVAVDIVLSAATVALGKEGKKKHKPEKYYWEIRGTVRATKKKRTNGRARKRHCMHNAGNATFIAGAYLRTQLPTTPSVVIDKYTYLQS